MSKKFKVLDYDIIYLSYDEPNAEKNYADLCSKVPWAKRVHGVEGSDSAHKACANLSETDRFVTVDGDNIIREEFLRQSIDFDEHINLENAVISWCGYNIINGLMYGNGGLKCWPKKHVLNMRTHENAASDNPHAQVDFCWDLEYIQQNGCFSDVYNNENPHQAWRAGFREGVKMALDRGVRPTDSSYLLKGHWKNLHRLWVWQMVGADVDNGLWAVYGARDGLYKTMCTDWDYINVRNFKYLNEMWENNEVKEENLLDKIIELGELLVRKTNIPIDPLPFNAGQSRFFKKVFRNPDRAPIVNIIDNEIKDNEK